MEGYDFDLNAIDCSMPQGSVVGLLLFWLYVKDLKPTIKCCKLHHFGDDTTILNFLLRSCKIL